MGPPGMGQPGMAQPGMGQPGMGPPGMGQPGMGQPGMGPPGMGQPVMGQPGMGQTGMGPPGMGQPGMGQPGMGQPGMGAPALMGSPMNSQMMNGTGSMMNGYGGASPNQTGTSFMPGANKSMLSLTDVDGEETTATTPMSRKKKGKKRDDDDDDQVAILREDLRMWSTSGTEIGKHILEKTGERHSEILARQKSDEGTDKILAELKVLKAAVDGIQETQQETLTMLGDLIARHNELDERVQEGHTYIKDEVMIAISMAGRGRKKTSSFDDELGTDADGQSSAKGSSPSRMQSAKRDGQADKDPKEVVAASHRDGSQPRWLAPT